MRVTRFVFLFVVEVDDRPFAPGLNGGAEVDGS
jgi:hypothetical protein